MRIYTRTGDRGETGLVGGKRVRKDDLRISVYGTIDELNSVLGLAIIECHAEESKQILTWLQNKLFDAGSDLATPFDAKINTLLIPRIESDSIEVIEKNIDLISEKLPELNSFILPGGSKSAALLHIARTVCRRAERLLVTLKEQEYINEKLIIFLNRISDHLFTLARYENFVQGIQDINRQK